jgi:hypothetical protein
VSTIKLKGLWTMLAVLGTASCAPLPDPDSSFEPKLAIPASATVAVISKGVDQDLKARFNRDSTYSGARTGANLGSAAGFAAASVPADRRAAGKDADALLEVSIGDIRFQQRDDGKYRWMLRVNLTAQWNRNRRRVRAGTQHYRVYSETLPLEEWMNDGGSAIERALDDLAIDASKRIEKDFFNQ